MNHSQPCRNCTAGVPAAQNRKVLFCWSYEEHHFDALSRPLKVYHAFCTWLMVSINNRTAQLTVVVSIPCLTFTFEINKNWTFHILQYYNHQFSPKSVSSKVLLTLKCDSVAYSQVAKWRPYTIIIRFGMNLLYLHDVSKASRKLSNDMGHKGRRFFRKLKEIVDDWKRRKLRIIFDFINFKPSITGESYV